MWVWEAGLPPNTKPPATTHYMLRLVGMGITSSLSVSGRALAGGGGARAQVGGKAPGCLTSRGQGMGALWPSVPHLCTCPSWGFSEARGGKAGGMVLGEPLSLGWLILALRPRKRSWTSGTCW